MMWTREDRVGWEDRDHLDPHRNRRDGWIEPGSQARTSSSASTAIRERERERERGSAFDVAGGARWS